MNKKILKNWDGLTGLVFVVFGLIYGYFVYITPKASFGNPMDPLYFPYGIAVLFIFLGALLIIKGGVKPSILAVKDFLNEDATKKRDRRKVLYTCIISVVYALTFDHLGYVLSTFLFMFAVLSLTNGLASWKVNTTVSLVFSIFIYYLFAKLLGISLPPLPFEIGGESW